MALRCWLLAVTAAASCGPNGEHTNLRIGEATGKVAIRVAPLVATGDGGIAVKGPFKRA